LLKLYELTRKKTLTVFASP